MIIKVEDGKVVHFFNNITELFSEYKVKKLELCADPTEKDLEEMLGGGIKITILGQYRLECIDIHSKIEVIHFNTEEDARKVYNSILNGTKRILESTMDIDVVNTAFKEMTLSKLGVYGKQTDLASVRLSIETVI